MFGPSGVSIGQTRPMVRRMDVAHFEACALARQAARPSADTRRLWVISDSGLVWSMNCDNCDDRRTRRYRRNRQR
jgi:hypothetical protein